MKPFSLRRGNNTEISRKSICSLEQDVGPCKGALQRWYFSEERNTCEPFVYSGCAGNRSVISEILVKGFPFMFSLFLMNPNFEALAADISRLKMKKKEDSD